MSISRTLWNQRITMQDGIEIAVDVILPEGAGPFPAVVSRTPYIRGKSINKPNGWTRLVGYGYAFVAVDIRGRNDSDGEWVPWIKDSEDAYQVIEWMAEQAWCSGKIGMVGASYVGLSQWWAAAARPPHLTCIAPLCVGAKSSMVESMDTGIPVQYWIWWMNYVNGKTLQYPGAPSWESNINHLPLKSLDECFGIGGSAWKKYTSGVIDSSSADCMLSSEDFSNIDIPVMIGVGWWDDQSTMDTWIALQQAKSAADCRLLIGAWDHVGNLAPRPVLGGIDMSASVMDTIGYVEKFLAIHLKGETNILSDAPRCRIFHTGKHDWENMDDWPSPHAIDTRFYLSSEGDARSLCGNGGLSINTPPESGNDTYTYDPNYPSRDLGNLDMFASSDPPLDHRYLHRRNDILVYDSAPLEKSLSLSGRVLLRVHISSDRPDTDLFVGINDVHPDGRAIGLFATNEPKGGLRLRYRNGPDAELMVPHDIYEVEVAGIWVHHTFKSGHRLRITIHSNDFPFAVRNAGTGQHWSEDIKLYPQINTIHHGPDYPSHVVLPVVPMGEF